MTGHGHTEQRDIPVPLLIRWHGDAGEHVHSVDSGPIGRRRIHLPVMPAPDGPLAGPERARLAATDALVMLRQLAGHGAIVS